MIDRINSILDESLSKAQEDPAKSYEIARGACEIAEKNNLVIETAYAHYCMAYACRVMSDYTNGLNYAFKALDVFEEHLKTEGIIKTRNIIGIIYFYYSDYKIALENFMIALDLLGTAPNPRLKSSLLNNIGEIHKVAKDYKKALACYSESLQISELNQLMINNSVINANIGEIYFLQGDYSKANLFYTKAFDYAMHTKDYIARGEAQRKLGNIEIMLGHYDLAREYLIDALQSFNHVNNKFYLVELLISFAELDMKIGRNPKQNLMDALNHAIENKLELKISSIYKILVNYHEAHKEFELALNYHKLYYQKEKEIEVSNLSMKLELLAIEFNYYKEKNKIEHNKKLSEKLKREIETSKKELQEIKEENEKLIEVSIIDELTQVYNRRGIDKCLKERLEHESTLLDLILMIDIDLFKKYNDIWGHVMGDVCLKMITSHLKDLNYDSYFIGRYGGEEFVCYMRVKDLDNAIEIAENIRKSVLDLQIAYTKESDSDYVSVSIGGIVDKMTVSKINQYIDVADKWLYHSKEEGRNRVSIVNMPNCENVL